jgi:hypothetical protein
MSTILISRVKKTILISKKQTEKLHKLDHSEETFLKQLDLNKIKNIVQECKENCALTS